MPITSPFATSPLWIESQSITATTNATSATSAYMQLNATASTSWAPMWYIWYQQEQYANAMQQQGVLEMAAQMQPQQGAIAQQGEQLWSAIRERPARDMVAKPAIILDAARKRAREHLLAHLTPEQRLTFEAHGWFVVEGGRSGTRYRVNGGHLIGNVDVLGPMSHVMHRLCAHGDRHDIPMDDHILAQKFWLEAAEDEFLRRANRHAVRW